MTAFNVWGKYGTKRLLEKVVERISDSEDPSSVLVLGTDGDDTRVNFRSRVKELFGSEELFNKFKHRLIFPAPKKSEWDGGEVALSLNSNDDTEEFIRCIKQGWQDNEGRAIKPDKEVRTIVQLQPGDKYLPLLQSKRPGIEVYFYQSVTVDAEDLKKDGIYPYESAANYAIALNSQALSQIQSRAIKWLYPGYLPRGMLVTLFAPKGRGKTKICDYFTSVLTTGRNWDDGTLNPHGPLKVLRFNLEDPVREVLKPALHAVKADLNNVEWVEPEATASADGTSSATSLNLSDPAHVEAVKNKVRQTAAALVIIEPLNNYKGQAKSNSEDDMRPIYMALGEVAKETGACVLVINHANKKKDVDVLEKSLGAGSGPAVARANWFLDKNPDNPEERVMANAGSNLPTGPALVFTVVSAPDFELDGQTHKSVGYAKFLRTENITGDELLERVQFTRKGEMENIAQFLREWLKGKGLVDTDSVKKACYCENPGWAWNLIKLTWSRRHLGISRTEGGGKGRKTYWALAGEDVPTENGTQLF